jgi:hypothetical protein
MNDKQFIKTEVVSLNSNDNDNDNNNNVKFFIGENCVTFNKNVQIFYYIPEGHKNFNEDVVSRQGTKIAIVKQIKKVFNLFKTD